jgi:hypothetical protein
MKIEFRKEETDDGDELSTEKLNPDVGGALLCGRLNLQREQEPKSQNKNEEHNSDLEKVQREKQGAQTRSKNSFYGNTNKISTLKYNGHRPPSLI